MNRPDVFARPAIDRPPVAEKSALTRKAVPSLRLRETRIVDFRSGEAVVRHPDLTPLLGQGWEVESAVPYVGNSEEVKLLVVIAREHSARDAGSVA